MCVAANCAEHYRLRERLHHPEVLPEVHRAQNHQANARIRPFAQLSLTGRPYGQNGCQN